jgi:hypothetical protein
MSSRWCSPYVTLPKYSFKSKFDYLLFCNPTLEEAETANRRETTISKPHGPIVMIGAFRSRDRQSDHIYYTLLWQVQSFAAPFTSLSKLCKHVGRAKTIFMRNGVFWVLGHEVSRELSGFLTLLVFIPSFGFALPAASLLAHVLHYIKSH